MDHSSESFDHSPILTRAARKPPLSLARVFTRVALTLLLLLGALVLTHFPWDTDEPLTAAQQERNRTYYATAYDKLAAEAETEENAEYVRIAKSAAETYDIKGQVRRFVAEHGLARGKVLDIGAGRGYLQDLAPDYTGLDISATARRFFHKKFVLGSATSMPFADSEFDGAWSIWVLEHVPNPEAALAEIRRVLKPGGVVMLYPAWSCTEFAAEGYPVRPYSDFDLSGKLTKASIPARLLLRSLAAPPVRFARESYWKASRQPLRLHYRRIQPNYRKYWMPDSDAVNSLDRYETALWFLSRGDECLNCEGTLNAIPVSNFPLFIRIRKNETPRPAHAAQARRPL
jgi:ubiquinone/menaquinone biosynthesis C-methylase UbiE